MIRKQQAPDGERDETLSAEYRRIAAESVPPELDRAVLRESLRAVRKSPTMAAPPFLRLLTMVASVAVVLAVAFQFTAKELDPQSEELGGDRLPVQAGGIADSEVATTDRRFCSSQQLATADTWRACIDELRRSGRLDEARREQALFDEAQRN